MKLFIILVAVVSLLVIGSTAEAARPNLLVNGSFDDGFNGWEMQGAYSLTQGVHGTNAVSLEMGFARQTGFKLNPDHMYKLTFLYRGLINTSAKNGNYLYSTGWSRAAYKFKASDIGSTLWFMGYQNSPIQIDNVRLVRITQ